MTTESQATTETPAVAAETPAPAASASPPPEAPVATAEATGKPEPSLLNQGVDSGTPSEAKPAEAAAPIFSPAELKLPEGVTLPEDVTGKLSELATEMKLGNEGVQKFVDLHMDLVKKAAEEPYQLWRDTQKQWQDEIKTDKIYGGERLNETLRQIGSVLSNPDLVDPEFRAALDFTGAGNNPAVFRTMAKIAAALSEGRPTQGNPPGAASIDLAKAFYPNLP